MAFDLFFAGGQAGECEKYLIQNGCNRLYSQLDNMKSIKEWIQQTKTLSNKLLVDSGAFSALTRGVKIDIDEYIAKIDAIGEDIYEFANLDVIPSEKEYNLLTQTFNEGWKNFLYIQNHSKYADKCCFVFHRGEPEDGLDMVLKYYKEHPQLKFFGIGGIAKGHKDGFNFARYICDKIKKEIPYIKIHLFGYTRLKELPYIKCDSTDSTTWIMVGASGQIATRFGLVSVSNGSRHKSDNFYNLPKNAQEVVLQELANNGFTLEQVSNDYKYRMIYNIRHFKNWSDNYKYTNLGIKKNTLL